MCEYYVKAPVVIHVLSLKYQYWDTVLRNIVISVHITQLYTVYNSFYFFLISFSSHVFIAMIALKHNAVSASPNKRLHYIICICTHT